MAVRPSPKATVSPHPTYPGCARSGSSWCAWPCWSRATIKIIPFAVPEASLSQAEMIGRSGGPIVALHPLRALPVGVVLVGSLAAQARIEHGVLPAIVARVVELGSSIHAIRYVPPDEPAIAAAIAEL